MSVRKAYTIFLFGLFVFLSVQTQGQENPFDLKYKLNKKAPNTAVIDTLDDSKSIEEQVSLPDTVSAVASEPAKDSIQTSKKEPSAVNNRDTVESEGTITLDDSNKPNQSSGFSLLDSGSTPKALSNLFLFIILLVITILSTLTIAYNKNLITNIIRSVLNDNYLNLIYREQKKSKSIKYLLLYLVFFLNAGLFAYLVIQHFNIAGYPLWECILIVAAIYGIRHLAFAVLAYIYPFKKEVEQFGFTILIFNIFLGLLLLPINVFIAFGPDISQNLIIYIGLILIALIYIFRQLRGLFIGSQILTSATLYFFIYLCAFEILPMLVFIKLGKGFFA